MHDEQIKYYEDEAWKKYFGTDLAEFYSNIEGFLALRDELIKHIADKTVDELIAESNIYKEMLLGGVTTENEGLYHENSLARFYKECIGISIAELQRIISRLREGLTLESATEGIGCKIEDTPIIEIIRKISAKLKYIYRYLRLPVEKKEYKNNDSLSALRALKDVLNAGKKLLPLYNPLSFFINSIYSIPRFYAKEAYPKLFDEETKNVLSRYGIYLETLIEPDFPDEKIRHEREIIGLVKNSVGYILREIIFDIYRIFQLDIIKKFFNIEDEFSKFIKINAGKLRENIVIDNFLSIIDRLQEEQDSDYYQDIRLPKGYKCISPIGYLILSGGNIGGDISYTEFIAFLAPLMFLGFASIRPVKGVEKTITYDCLLGWANK